MQPVITMFETILDWLLAATLLALFVFWVITCVIPWAGCDSATYEQVRYAFDANTLAEAEAGIMDETDEFLRLNRAVTEAEYGVPFWTRMRIDARILRQLDYWRRLDAALARVDAAEGGARDAR
jgi:hypothetical protein